MTEFVDGPAAGQVLFLKRAPLYLRVVGKHRGRKVEWDALDQLGDTPAADERLYAYRLVEDQGWVHIRSGKRGASGFFRVAKYALVESQPADAVLRDRESWRAWTWEEHRRSHEHRTAPAAG